MIGRLLLLIGIVGAPGLAAAADGLALGLPLRCELNRTCFIQQFMDIDPGPEAADYTCGPLTYDGHSGTDFRLPDRQAMRDGVEVVAALAGVVRGTRDGMADVDIATVGGRETVKGRECGNGVVIDHADGWQTQYCHMRNGSLRVSPGQRVEKGEVLGFVGMSGAAQFPHVHLAVRKDGDDVDPFRGVGPEIQCGGDYKGLWDRELAAQLDYRPGGILNAGLYGNAPQYIDVKEGRATVTRIAPDSPALVIWFHVFGIREGDVMRLQIESPDGSVFHDDTRPAHPKNQAQYFAFSGRRTPEGGLKSGVYRGRVQMLREGRVYDARPVSVEVR